MNEKEALIDALNNKKPLVAMIAPSFPIVFKYPAIITMLKRLGISHVVEVAVGAKKTNEELIELLRKNPQARFITSPCPTIVRMVRSQMPQYAKYFTHGVDSPMVATAKIVAQRYPNHQPVFIGPCIMKKIEAKEDHPELNITVVTYDELNQVFEHFAVAEETNPNDHFDLTEPSMTRLYPVDGGLSHSSGITSSFNEGKVKTVSEWTKCIEAIKEFDEDPHIRLLDILFCKGGCIGGPGIKSDLDATARRQKILDYYLQNPIPATE